MKRILNILSWAAIIAYLVIVLGFVSVKQHELPCSSINVEITDKTKNFFVDEQDVISLIYDKGDKILGFPIDSLNMAKLEDLIKHHPSIKRAEIYGDLQGVLNIDIEQRNPIIRIINYNKESYYIDDQGALMPLSNQYTAHVLVANGDINEPYSLRYTTNIMTYNEEDELNRGKILRDLFVLARFINDNEFWLSQIEQIYVKKGEFELVPRVGTHVIKFGSIKNYKKKFRNLKAVYEVGFKKFGWNNYTQINLKYDNQVICTKR